MVLVLGFGRCTHRTSKIGNIGACWNILANRRRQIADVNVVKNSSVVTTTKLSLPPRWLATTEPYGVLGPTRLAAAISTDWSYGPTIFVICLP